MGHERDKKVLKYFLGLNSWLPDLIIRERERKRERGREREGGVRRDIESEGKSKRERE